LPKTLPKKKRCFFGLLAPGAVQPRNSNKRKKREEKKKNAIQKKFKKREKE